MKSYGICLSLTGLFHLALYSPAPSTLLEMARFHFYGWIIFHCIYHIFFIYSSIDGHLGYFHNLAIVNNAAINIGCMYPFKLVFLYSLGKYPVVQWLDRRDDPHTLTHFHASKPYEKDGNGISILQMKKWRLKVRSGCTESLWQDQNLHQFCLTAVPCVSLEGRLEEGAPPHLLVDELEGSCVTAAV